MFICKHCQLEKESSELVKGYKSRCKECDKTIRAAWSKQDKLKNPEKYNQREKDRRNTDPKYRESCRIRSNNYNAKHREERLAYQKDRQQERQDFINSFKDKPCMDCGNKFPNYCMDFDHVRGEKKDNLSGMKSNRTLEKIFEEIQKCELVCANCHRIRTQSRFSTSIYAPSS